MDRGSANWPVVIAGVVLLAFSPSSAGAQSPSLKELLDKAQSKSDAIAVEEIVKGLKPKEPAPAAAPPVASPPTVSQTPPPPAPPASVGTPPPETATTAPPVSTPPASSESPPTGVAERDKEPSTTTPAAPDVTATTTAPPTSPPAGSPPPAATASDMPSQPPAEPAAPSSPPPAATTVAEREPPPSLDFEILFSFDSSAIAKESHALLSRLGMALTDDRLASRRFEIVGHTDGKGGAAYNLALSKRRAEAVRVFLLENFNLDPARLKAVGKGESQLKNKRNPLAGENRRVEVVSLPFE